MLHGKSHHEATGHRRNWKTDPSNKQTRAVHARCNSTLQKGICRVLVSQFNPSDPGKGMVKLLEDGSNLLTIVKSTDAIMANSVLKAAKNKADAASKAVSTTIAPAITSCLEAQEEANQLNVINQLVIGAKEGVVKAVKKLVGRDIPHAVLQTADGSNHKSIDDYTLFAVMAAAIDGAD